MFFILLFSQNSFASCHYIKHNGNNFYYSNSKGDVYDFIPAYKKSVGLSIADIKDKYNLELKHSGASNVITFFSCNGDCRIITISYVEVYGLISGSLVAQKQVIRKPGTILGTAMSDDINGCMEKQELANRKKAQHEDKQFVNEMAPSSGTLNAYRRLRELSR